jgi:hypothetical protein
VARSERVQFAGNEAGISSSRLFLGYPTVAQAVESWLRAGGRTVGAQNMRLDGGFTRITIGTQPPGFGEFAGEAPYIA